MFKVRTKNSQQPRGSRLREIRNAKAIIFEHYSNHEYDVRLRKLSEVLDRQPEILERVAATLSGWYKYCS